MKKKQRETIKKALCIAAGLVLTAGCADAVSVLRSEGECSAVRPVRSWHER